MPAGNAGEDVVRGLINERWSALSLAVRNRFTHLADRWFWPAALVLSIIASSYLAFVGLRLVDAAEVELTLPSHVVRLEVITAVESDSLRVIADRLDGLRDEVVDVVVVTRTVRPDNRPEQSFVMSRTETTAGAEHVAMLLGVDPERVFYREREYNRDHVTATLVVGDDWRSLLAALPGESNN